MRARDVRRSILPTTEFKSHASAIVRDRFLAAVEEGLADVEANRVVSDEELGRALDRQLRCGRRR